MPIKRSFILSVKDEFCNSYFEDFVCKDLGMELSSVGCGTVDFWSNKKPRNFDKRLIKRFGTIVSEVSKSGFLNTYVEE